MLICNGNQFIRNSVRKPSGIIGYAKSDRKRIVNETGTAHVPAPALQDQTDRAARIMRIMMLAAGGMNHPVHHDLRGSLIDTYG